MASDRVAGPAPAEEPELLESAIRDVTVFGRGACVVRVAERRAGSTATLLAFDGLPKVLADDSVRIALDGEAGAAANAVATGAAPAITDVRVEWVLPPAGDPLQAQGDAERRALEDRLAELRVRLARVQRDAGRFAGVKLALPAVPEHRSARPVPIAAWQGWIDWKHRRLQSLAEERLELTQRIEEAEEALARAKRAQQERRAQADSRADAVRKRVVFRLRGGEPGAALRLRLEYWVAGARWAPAYRVQLARDGRSAQLGLQALVVQATGEPWSRVNLSLSTAEPLGDASLPDLHSLRIGRQQAPPPPRAWREPPLGLDGLFEGIDRVERSAIAAPRTQVAHHVQHGDVDFDVGSAATGAYEVPDEPMILNAPVAAGPPPGKPRAPRPPTPRPPPAPAAMAMPIPAPMPAAAPASAKSMQVLRGGGPAQSHDADMMQLSRQRMAGAMVMEEQAEYAVAESSPPEPETWQPAAQALRYQGLVMGGWNDGGHRGRLHAAAATDQVRDADPKVAAQAAWTVENAAAVANGAVRHATWPAGTSEVAESRGSFHFRYDAEGPVDVPGDGAVHLVPLATRAAPVRSTLVVVPRESSQAVRVAHLRNPLDAPLLAGPADVFLGEEFLVTAPIRTVPAGGDLQLGLGVEEGLKVARNTFYEEESAGMLGGIALQHRVTIDLANRLAAPVQVEVRERVPVRAEGQKDVDVVVATPTPRWEDFEQAETGRIRGGKRWRLELAAGESRSLEFSYTIKLASRSEVTGGNRRE